MDGFLESDAFAGKTAVVTGGGTGLGLDISRLLAALGARVAILSRSAEHHETFLAEARERGWPASSHPCDVREPARLDEAMAEIVAEFGSLDVLVNNAAGNFIRPSLTMPPKGWQAVIDIALSGVFYASQAAAKRMPDGGAMVNIIAPYAWTGCPGVVHSVSAKAGVLAMTKSLAVEWAPRRIRVNAVAPGPFHSEGAAARLWPDEDMRRAIEAQVPWGRFGTTEEVARAVVFLAAPCASYITGACLTVDGGFSLGKGLHGDVDVPAVSRVRDDRG